ncbi:hypothetical protein CRUP_025464, partial [Coryphaenoides rupestris]
MESIPLSPEKTGKQTADSDRSFLLVDEQENLQVHDEHKFLEQLGCGDMSEVKVLSIFGNTGDGKSHTLNHILFGGETVFYTSKSPSSCTVGVWAAYDPALSLLALDTEGLLGAATNQNQRMRLLLKRLHNDMFHFLSSASAAYLKHFTPELRALSSRCGLDVPLSCLGPAIIVFQETTHTQLLGHESLVVGHADTLLQRRFHDLGLSTEAFSAMQYVGTQTVAPPTDYSLLLEAVRQQVRNTHTRSPRQPAIVFRALEALSERFCGEISDDLVTLHFFPDEYFTCSSVCLSCSVRCKNGMNHLRDKRCYEGGREVIVVPKTSSSADNPWLGLAKYAWSGTGWGTRTPESSVVRPEGEAFLVDHQNAAQRVLDGVNYVVQSVSEYSTGPTKAVTAWLTDQVAPPYWRPNNQITLLPGVQAGVFGETERNTLPVLGEASASPASGHRMPSGRRGWGATPCRVCLTCTHGGRGHGTQGFLRGHVRDIPSSLKRTHQSRPSTPLLLIGQEQHRNNSPGTAE